MLSFREIFENHNGRMIDKWDHYFEIYDRYFSNYRDKPVRMLEIGVSEGGSLQVWRKYFGEQAEIFGVDIIPACKQFEDEKTKIFIGSQEDKVFLAELKSKLPLLDILIDDGGHTMKQQIISFDFLFSQVKDGGIYLVEDTHTSYWREWKGGYKRRGSFIEYAKNLVDQIYAWHIRNNKVTVNFITENVHAISFYDSVVVIEKKRREKPFGLKKGERSLI